MAVRHIATSVVVPMFDEEARISRTLPTLQQLARGGIEIVVVDDGSRDRTPELLAQVVTNPLFRVVSLPTNRGKGAAVRHGALAARGDVVAFMDADLATDPACLAPLCDALAFADIAIGSRALPASELHGTTRQRSRMGGNFNRLVRVATGLELRDTQCGFKAFRAPIAKLLFGNARVDGFAFDVEVLCLARRYGLRVVEIPVVWTQVPGTKVRMVRDPIRMALDVLRARAQARDAAATPVLCTELSSARSRPGGLAQAVRSCAPDRLVVTAGSAVLMAAPAGGAATVDLALEHLRDAVPDLATVDRTFTVDEFLRLADDGMVVRAERAGAPERHGQLAMAPTGLE